MNKTFDEGADAEVTVYLVWPNCTDPAVRAPFLTSRHVDNNCQQVVHMKPASPNQLDIFSPGPSLIHHYSQSAHISMHAEMISKRLYVIIVLVNSEPNLKALAFSLTRTVVEQLNFCHICFTKKHNMTCRFFE